MPDEFIPLPEEECLAIQYDLLNDAPVPYERQVHFYKSLLHWNRLKYASASSLRAQDNAIKATKARKPKVEVNVPQNLLDLL